MDNSSSSASALGDLGDIQVQISKLTEMLNARYARLGEAEKKLEYEREAFEKAHKMISTFEDPIKLNVGGKIFMTSKSTLLKEESMLYAMFSGRHTIQKGGDGAYFIDRDPKYFRKVLNYLRDGELEAYKDEVEKKEILREAEYYCITGLIELLSNASSVPAPVQADPTKLLVFDPIQKGAFIELRGDMARLVGEFCQSATIASLTKGVHSCMYKYRSISSGYPMFGISSANNINFSSGAHTQSQSMMLSSGAYDLYVAGQKTKKFGFPESETMTVELDCDRKTVSWSSGATKFTEPIHAGIKAPYSFCVDLFNCGVVLTERTSRV